MNYKQLLSLSFFIFSFCCNAAELPNGSRPIPFNRDVVGKPKHIYYNNDEYFMIAGATGFEIQQGGHKNKNEFQGKGYFWNFIKDNKTVVPFNLNEISIADFNQKDPKNISLKKNYFAKICDVDLDANKNTVFIAYEHGDPLRYPRKEKLSIRKYYYNTDSYTYFDWDWSIFSDINCISLNASKDILYIFNHYNVRALNTNDLASLTEIADAPIGNTQYCKIFGNKIAISNDGSICIVDIDKNNPYVVESHLLYPMSPKNRKIKYIAFHPSGVLAALVSHYYNGHSLYYWNIATRNKIDKTPIIGESSHVCFSPDGLKLALVVNEDCIEQPVSSKVINHYILSQFWLKLKTIQKYYNLPQDIMVHCMNVFSDYFIKLE